MPVFINIGLNGNINISVYYEIVLKVFHEDLVPVILPINKK